MSETKRNATIDYVEFPAKDLSATEAFYHSLFGWEFTHWGEGYISFSNASLEGGFDASRPVIDSGGPLVVIYADELEDTLVRIKEAGAAIVKEIFSFPGGRRFLFKDPNGNELAVWTQESI